MSALSFIPDVSIMTLAFVLVTKYRNQLKELFKRIRLSRFLLFMISSIPFILFEETINCPPNGCTVPVVSTLPMLLVFIFILGIVVRWLKAKNIPVIVIVFSILGVLFEVFFGIQTITTGWIGQLPLPQVIFFLFWIGLSYAFLVIVPIKILVEN